MLALLLIPPLSLHILHILSHFSNPISIIIFNVYPQIAEKRRTKSTMFANVAFCLIFQFTWYLSESAGFETEIHSRADFQLAHFTAGLDGTAFRHACLLACLPQQMEFRWSAIQIFGEILRLPLFLIENMHFFLTIWIPKDCTICGPMQSFQSLFSRKSRSAQ